MDTPILGPDEVTLVGAVTREEATLFRDIGRKAGPLPEGVHELRFRFGEDSQGDLAVWIVLVADDDLKPSKAKVESIKQFTRKLQDEIMMSESDRWPYSEVVTI